MPNINEMLFKLKGFQYDTSINFKMGYYHILLRKNSSNLCMIILPRVKHCYKRLPIEIANSPDILHQKINNLFQVF